jgi:hypothetical protein
LSENACVRTLQSDKETELNGGVVAATEQDAEEKDNDKPPTIDWRAVSLLYSHL